MTGESAEGATLAAWAAWYASQGVPVFPLRPGHKKPLPGSHGVDDATTDAATVAAWWQQHPHANIGAACGVRFDVVDVDGPAGSASLDALYPEGWPATVARVRTPRPGGLHCYLPTMGAPVKAGGRGGMPPGVDTRGAGGYVVLPPSRLVDTPDQHAGAYWWEGDTPTFGPPDVATVRACKPWRRVWDTPAPVVAPAGPRAPLAPSEGTTRYGVRVLDDEAATVAAAPPGGRNDALNRAAFKVGQLVPHEVTEADALAALLDAARACGLPDAEARATLASGLGKGKAQPRQPEERPAGDPLAGLLDRTPAPRIDPATGEVLDDDDDDDAGPPPGDGPASDVLADLVFDATPLLSTIRQAAHARLVTPWAVLGAVLARVVAEVPPHVVLPPLVGSDASLNLAVALVADSGGGKSGALSCAGDIVRLPGRHARTIGPGSGEGIMMAFLEKDPDPGAKGNRLRAEPLALLAADEVAQIGAVQGRASQATFGPIVRSMLTGDEVSTTAADADRCRRLPRNGYRLAIVAGVQPPLAGVLLDDTDAGTPQRWLWLPADDPGWNAPPTSWPAPITWTFPRPPEGSRDPDGKIRIPVPPEVAAAVYDARVRRLRREGDPLDGHRLLTREKVAAALALLHGEFAITPDWWKLSGLVMARSDATRAHCAATLAAKAEDQSRARGRLDAVRESGAREARTDDAMKHARLVWRYVSTGAHSNAKHDPAEGCTARCVGHALRHHPGADRAAALDVATDLAWIEERDGRWFPGPARPADAEGGRP